MKWLTAQGRDWPGIVQITVLLLIGAYLLITTPDNWIQFPDSGIYLGTAEELLKNGKYWFNAYPNLQYYPGTSLLLATLLWMFDSNFLLLQGTMGLVSFAGIWLIRSYFPAAKYGVAGLVTPVLVLFSSLYLIQYYSLLSDSLFVTLSFVALLSWRKHLLCGQNRYLYCTILVVAFASLVRLQGLFLCLALCLAIFYRLTFQTSSFSWKQLLKAALLCVLTCLPFVLWTTRNYLLHTPDTYTLSNGYFFGMWGMEIYAKGLPGNVSAQGITSAWQFAYQRSVLFVGLLFESWYGGISFTSKIIVTLGLLAGFFAGLTSWIKKSNLFEFTYVLLSLGFIAKTILLTQNLHIVERYWLPMLPFFILIVCLGIQQLINLPIFNRLQLAPHFAALLMLLGLLVTASSNLKFHLDAKQKWLVENQNLSALEKFVETSVPEDAIMATVDWGVLPRSVQRESYTLLNDPDNKQSIAKMLKYQTDYLVTYDKYARMNTPALKMVARYPNAFTKVFATQAPINNTRIQVFKVDLQELRKALVN